MIEEPSTPKPEMEERLAGALREIHGLLAPIGADARASRDGVAEVRSVVAKMRYDVDMLTSYVHSKPPPPPPEGELPTRVALPSLSDHIREVAGGVVSEELRELRALRQETRAQSVVMGIGVTGFKWLMTREGRTFAAACAALMFAVATVIGGARQQVITVQVPPPPTLDSTAVAK